MTPNGLEPPHTALLNSVRNYRVADASVDRAVRLAASFGTAAANSAAVGGGSAAAGQTGGGIHAVSSAGSSVASGWLGGKVIAGAVAGLIAAGSGGAWWWRTNVRPPIAGSSPALEARSAGEDTSRASGPGASAPARTANAVEVRTAGAAKSEVGSSVAPSPASAPAVNPRTRTVVQRTEAAPPAESGVAAEVALVERARSALAGGNPQVALSELHQYEREFPQGMLKSEALVLRVQSLHAAGQTSQARALAAEYIRRNPTSIHATRLQRFAQEK